MDFFFYKKIIWIIFRNVLPSHYYFQKLLRYLYFTITRLLYLCVDFIIQNLSIRILCHTNYYLQWYDICDLYTHTYLCKICAIKCSGVLWRNYVIFSGITRCHIFCSFASRLHVLYLFLLHATWFLSVCVCVVLYSSDIILHQHFVACWYIWWHVFVLHVSHYDKFYVGGCVCVLGNYLNVLVVYCFHPFFIVCMELQSLSRCDTI